MSFSVAGLGLLMLRCSFWSRISDTLGSCDESYVKRQSCRFNVVASFWANLWAIVLGLQKE